MGGWKIKIAVLWLFTAVGRLGGMVLMFMMPGYIPLGGIPLTMAFLSLILEDPTNRRVNIIVGILWAALHIVSSSRLLIQGQLSILALIEVSRTVAAVLIVWYAWKSKQEVVTKPEE